MTRPTKRSIEITKLKQTRELARCAVSHWRDHAPGMEGDEIQQQAIIRYVDEKNLASVVERYPRAIKKRGKENIWDMPTLELILHWEDPVTMLVMLASVDPGSWFSQLAEVEENGCSRAQEDAIRAAKQMIHLMGPVDTSGDGPTIRGNRLFQENRLLLLK